VSSATLTNVFNVFFCDDGILFQKVRGKHCGTNQPFFAQQKQMTIRAGNILGRQNLRPSGNPDRPQQQGSNSAETAPPATNKNL
jgi:hypothetical protein